MKDVRQQLQQLLAQRILVLDGAWGVLIHRQGLSEEEYRGERFREHARDVKGDPDLLNLTAPHVVSELHDAYFAAGADIATTNTFTATSIGQADYALGDFAAEMSLAGARLARASADEWNGRTPEKPRFVAGSVGPLNVTLSLSPQVDDAAYRAVTLRAGAGGVRGADRRAPRRRRRPPAGRDDLRHAEREGGDRRSAPRRAGAPALALVHGDRPERAESLGSDLRRVLGLGRARRALHRRSQLLAGSDGDAAVPRGARERRLDVRLLPSQRRAAERARAARRAGGGHESLPPRVRRGRPRQRRRGLLRDDARAHTGDRASGRRPASAPRSRAVARAALLRARSVHDPAGHGLRRRRRAHERDRLGEVPAAHRGERLPGRGRGRARAGARRGEPARREHGRGPARRRGGDDDVPQPPRDRAGGRAPADHGRQLALLRARGRAPLPAGEGSRQLDLL